MTSADPGAAWNPIRDARRIMRAATTATLATAHRERMGWPMPSLVQIACDADASPLLLMSTLAEHMKNILVDPRVGLLFDGTAGYASALAGPRVSILGHADRADEASVRDRYLARHPDAADYATFGDFSFWRIRVDGAHLVSGFGRIRWMPAADLLVPIDQADALALRAADIVEHMNEDHADAVALYATVLLGLPAGAWRMTGVDCDGCDLRSGALSGRLPFETPAMSAEDVRVELVRLVKQARHRSDAAVEPGAHRDAEGG